MRFGGRAGAAGAPALGTPGRGARNEPRVGPRRGFAGPEILQTLQTFAPLGAQNASQLSKSQSNRRLRLGAQAVVCAMSPVCDRRERKSFACRREQGKAGIGPAARCSTVASRCACRHKSLGKEPIPHIGSRSQFFPARFGKTS